jgi:hypothetical protein
MNHVTHLKQDVRDWIGLKLIVHPMRERQARELLREKALILGIKAATLSYLRPELIVAPSMATHVIERRRKHRFSFLHNLDKRPWESDYETKLLPILGCWMTIWGAKKTIYL